MDMRRFLNIFEGLLRDFLEKCFVIDHRFVELVVVLVPRERRSPMKFKSQPF